MLIYQVPEEIRKKKLRRALAMEYTAIGRRMLEDFIAYIKETIEQAFEELLRRK